MKTNLSTNIGKLKLKNPVMVASGTFGYGEEFKDFIDLKKLGAIVTKTITLRPRRGNSMPRTVETASGMLNSIGLENPGLEVFIKEKLPKLKKIAVPIIVSIASEGELQEFVELAKRLDKIEAISAIELNLSCPNIHGRRKLTAQDAKATFETVEAVRKNTKKVIIAKLSPNVTDITEIARAAERAGADAVSLINTLYGMSIDIDTREPNLGNIIGGLSGPAIKPVALKMVYDVARSVSIPVIGMGGIMNAADALEFIIAGATAIAIGTANFINPKASIEVIEGIEKYLAENKIKGIKTIVRSVKR